MKIIITIFIIFFSLTLYSQKDFKEIVLIEDSMAMENFIKVWEEQSRKQIENHNETEKEH